MADIQHSAIPDGQRHEPKGISTATVNQVYVADGAASGTWEKVPTQALSGIAANGTAGQVVVVDGAGGFAIDYGIAHGSVYFTNIATPYTLTYPATYTKIAPTTTAGGGGTQFTEATTARLTYTGTRARRAHIRAQLSLAQSVGADRDIQVAVYKNGVIIAESVDIITAVSSQKRSIGLLADVACVTNDYFEMYAINNGASGDVLFYSISFAVTALLN